MKLISWNVNGLRAILKKGFLDFVKEHNPDVLCIQETKPPGEDIEFELPGYEKHWNHAEKKGYSSVLTLCKNTPLNVIKGIGIAEHDNEGRVLTTEFKDFNLVNVYTPNSKRDLARLPYRHKQWDVEFLKFVKKLDKKKPTIFCGDLNVAHKEIDLKNPKSNQNTHGFTKEEREGFDNIVKAGFVDSFREFNQEPNNYSWWSYMGGCRARNVGWRIDYFCVSEKIKSNLLDAKILPDVMGSDHCPVEITLK